MSYSISEMWDGHIHSREIIGTVDVDSGTVMIIDPCYVLPDERTGWPAGIPDGGDPSAWSELIDGESSVYLSATDFVGSDKRHAEWGGGVVTHTLYGDGGYPVIAEKNAAGAVVRIIIDFGSEGLNDPLIADDPWAEDEDEEDDDA